MNIEKGKNCILTGPNKGIGKAILEELAINGINCWALTRTITDEFKAFTKDLSEKYGVWITIVPVDLTDNDSISAALKQVFSEKKSIDYLVNNAAIIQHGLFSMVPISDIQRIFQVNLYAPIVIMQKVLRKMQRQKNGSVVNMCSVAGLDSHQGDSIYGSSKSALATITKTTASEFAQYGIRINAVAPGPIETVAGLEMFEKMNDTAYKNSAMQRYGKPEEIAKTVMFLLSDDSSFINGQIIRADGGTL